MLRREFLRHGIVLTGGAALPAFPSWMRTASGAVARQAAKPADALTTMRTQIGSIPLESVTLTDNLTMLGGPGGNVIVLTGRDGKLVVDTFVQPAWAALKQRIDGLGSGRITALINTHWHFDHSDNNASFRTAGAEIVAHANTKKRLSESHDLLGAHFDPAPPEALPTRTFTASHSLDANGEQVTVGYIPPAHTDTDVYVRFTTGNVLHLGDVFFNGMYPFIDASTGGSINGMIGGTNMAMKLADSRTKIVPGHGPLGDLAALTRYRDMLVTARDRVQKLKSSGQTLEQVLAAKPTAELDETWGKGFMNPANFLAIVYNTL
jgi:glyoxylase-like metal-dependent hydrolase (beta-lactamase superfamily II)